MALDGPGRARPTALLDEERKDRSSQAVGVPDWSAGSDRGGTGGSPGDGWTPSITQAAADSNTMPGYCAGPLGSPEKPEQCSAGSPIRRLAQPRRACAPRDHEPRGDPRRTLLVRRIDEAKHFAGRLVDPVMLVVDPVVALNFQVGLVSSDNVGCLDSRNVVHVHVCRHGAHTPPWQLHLEHVPRLYLSDGKGLCHVDHVVFEGHLGNSAAS